MNDLSHTHMRAAVWHGRHDIRVEQVPLPDDPPPGWVQIKVDWCGICGSDLHEYVAGPVFIPVEAPHPLTGIQGQCILGHEFCGEIAKLGEGVSGYAVGDAVAADACQHCGSCYYCTHGLYNICEQLAFTGLMNNGAFAERVNVPANLLYRLPEGFPREAGALIEPLAVGMHAVKKAGSLLGQNVVVVGAGTIGLCTIMCAKAAGAAQVIALEMSSARKAKALQVGASAVLDPSQCDALAEIRGLTAGLGADVSFECIGNKHTAKLAIDAIRKAGKVRAGGDLRGAQCVQLLRSGLDRETGAWGVGLQRRIRRCDCLHCRWAAGYSPAGDGAHWPGADCRAGVRGVGQQQGGECEDHRFAGRALISGV